MEATLLLANSAETHSNGLVSALGIGWSVTTTPTPATALILLIKVPWDRTNMKHTLLLNLVTEDGTPVLSSEAGTPQPVQVEGQFEVGRPVGIPPGTPIDQSMSLQIGGGLALEPGHRYQWRLGINGEQVASRSFLCARVG